MSPAPKWKMLYFSFKSWKSKVCQLWPLVMGISPLLHREGHLRLTHGSGWASAHLSTGAAGGMASVERRQESPEQGLPGARPGDVGLESASSFFFFCPHACKRDQAQTLLTLTGEGLSCGCPLGRGRSPAESGRACGSLVWSRLRLSRGSRLLVKNPPRS